jgi:hypothetical protein
MWPLLLDGPVIVCEGEVEGEAGERLGGQAWCKQNMECVLIPTAVNDKSILRDWGLAIVRSLRGRPLQPRSAWKFRAGGQLSHVRPQFEFGREYLAVTALSVIALVFCSLCCFGIVETDLQTGTQF